MVFVSFILFIVGMCFRDVLSLVLYILFIVLNRVVDVSALVLKGKCYNFWLKGFVEMIKA